MLNKKLNVALVGLQFGGAFVPIWRDHPDVASIGICDLDKELMDRVAKVHGITRTYDSLDEILADDSIDAVHLVTCIPDHAEQTIRVLNAGKHCACTVPMATSLEDMRRITEAVRASGKNYMMMETTLYTYQYLFIKDQVEKGEVGRIQFMRGSHYQDMENWPSYWLGLPPFWYGTHALAPMIGLSGSRIDRVSCLGSGSIRKELVDRYGSPFAVESVHLHFENGMAAEATRSLFEVARLYQEGLFVYGSKRTYEWPLGEACELNETELDDEMWLGAQGLRGKKSHHRVLELPNMYQTLPEPLWQYTVGGNYDETNPQLSLVKGAGGGHHGSHPHLVHEFARSIIEERKPAIDEVLAANITAAGVCAHESALQGGKWIDVPVF